MQNKQGQANKKRKLEEVSNTGRVAKENKPLNSVNEKSTQNVNQKSGRTLVAVPKAIDMKHKQEAANKKGTTQPGAKRILTEKVQKERAQERQEVDVHSQQNALVSQVIIGGSFSFYGKHISYILPLVLCPYSYTYSTRG